MGPALRLAARGVAGGALRGRAGPHHGSPAAPLLPARPGLDPGRLRAGGTARCARGAAGRSRGGVPPAVLPPALGTAAAAVSERADPAGRPAGAHAAPGPPSRGRGTAATRPARAGGGPGRARALDPPDVAGRDRGQRRLPRLARARPPRAGRRAAGAPLLQRTLVGPRAHGPLGHADREPQRPPADHGRSSQGSASADARAAGRPAGLARPGGRGRPRVRGVEPAPGRGRRHPHLWRRPRVRRPVVARPARGAAAGGGRPDADGFPVPAALGPGQLALPDPAVPAGRGPHLLGRRRAGNHATDVGDRAAAVRGAPGRWHAAAAGLAQRGPPRRAVPAAGPRPGPRGAREERHPARLRVVRAGLSTDVRERRAHRGHAALERAVPAPAAAVPGRGPLLRPGCVGPHAAACPASCRRPRGSSRRCARSVEPGGGPTWPTSCCSTASCPPMRRTACHWQRRGRAGTATSPPRSLPIPRSRPCSRCRHRCHSTASPSWREPTGPACCAAWTSRSARTG